MVAFSSWQFCHSCTVCGWNAVMRCIQAIKVVWRSPKFGSILLMQLNELHSTWLWQWGTLYYCKSERGVARNLLRGQKIVTNRVLLVFRVRLYFEKISSYDGGTCTHSRLRYATEGRWTFFRGKGPVLLVDDIRCAVLRNIFLPCTGIVCHLLMLLFWRWSSDVNKVSLLVAYP